MVDPRNGLGRAVGVPSSKRTHRQLTEGGVGRTTDVIAEFFAASFVLYPSNDIFVPCASHVTSRHTFGQNMYCCDLILFCVQFSLFNCILLEYISSIIA